MMVEPVLFQTFMLTLESAPVAMMPSRVSEYCAPLVKTGGRVIAYKGDAEEEVAEAKHAAAVLGLELEHVKKYRLPQDMGARTLAVYKKIRPTPQRFPRGQGKERKNPL